MHRIGSDATTKTRARPRTKTYIATTRQRRWTFPRGDLPSEKDGGGRSRTDANDERDLGWATTGAKTWAGRQLAATWSGRQLAHTTYVKMARRKKRASTIGEKKFGGRVHTLGLPSLNAKSLGVGLFLDFANNTKCKIHLQSPLKML